MTQLLTAFNICVQHLFTLLIIFTKSYLVEIGGAKSRGNTGKVLPPCSCVSYQDGGNLLCTCENSLRPTIQKKAFPKKSKCSNNLNDLIFMILMMLIVVSK